MTFHEIAPHPWAGLPVVIRLSAVDAIGQTAYSEEVKLVLPERRFDNPVAKEIITERRRLTTQPERRSEIVDRLSEIAGATGAYNDDTVVFLGLIHARSRLLHEKANTAISRCAICCGIRRSASKTDSCPMPSASCCVRRKL